MDDEFDDICVVQINAGDEAGAEIILDFNGKRMSLSFFASAATEQDGLSTAIENRVIRLLNGAAAAADKDYDELIDKALNFILEVGGPSLRAAAPRIHEPSPSPTAQDVHSFLYPETLYFRLQTINGRPSMFQISPDEGVCIPQTQPAPCPDSAFQPCAHLPRHSARDVSIQEILLRGTGLVARVHVNGNEVLCKASRRGLCAGRLERELCTLQSMQESTARPGAAIRAPSLIGYVVHADTDVIIGLLREWIPASPSQGN
ncbi:hypothetical protein NQ176_g8247 [Zarea fungicola]|uniref:Uncharacterized protein n=1 Tax=Zarea fungicola TaxID=93591 RepID=A0ACC1MVP0_9HYPO|nr:hypothetical protein NQ176_g8247 [Lecanicillium fungicola]